MEKKNQVLMTVLGVFALVIVTVGVSYAFFTYTRTSENAGTIQTGSLDFGFTESSTQNITLENVLPVANNVGVAANEQAKNVSVYNFTVSYTTTGNINTTYDVTLLNNGSDLNTDLVKYVFGTTGSTFQEADAKVLTDALGTKLVDNATITSGTPVNYTLKMWIDAKEAGFDATDNGSGTLAPGAEDNYTSEDGQTASWLESGKSVSVKIRVDARGTAQ